MASRTGPAVGRRGWGARIGGVVLLVAVGASLLTSSGPRAGLAEQAADFDRVYAAYQGWFLGERDERGTGYTHWRYEDLRDPAGARTLSTEIDYARMGRGSQIALWRRDRNAAPGFGLDYLHQPGSQEDLVLLGDRFRESVVQPGFEEFPPRPITTALWIARPTTLADAGGWSPCATAGTAQFCGLDQSVQATRAAVPGVPRTVAYAEDGTVTARTAIRFMDLVATLAPTNARQLALLEPVLHELVPFTIVLGPDGRFVRAELNGRLATAAASIEMQVGQESHGPATAADFPPGPTDDSQIQRVSRLEWVVISESASKLANRDLAADVDPDPGAPG
jgi:hypothetical protein